jgi:hypothetical protein
MPIKLPNMINIEHSWVPLLRQNFRCNDERSEESATLVETQTALPQPSLS